MTDHAGVERRSAYLRITGAFLTGAAALIGALALAVGLSALDGGNGPQGQLVTGIGLVLLVVALAGVVALVIGRVRRRYP